MINVRAILMETLPRRRGRTLLHLACAEHSDFAVRNVLDMAWLCVGSDSGAICDYVNLQTEDDGITALMPACANGSAQVAPNLPLNLPPNHRAGRNCSTHG